MIGLLTFETAPTAPHSKVVPSIRLASHSTVPFHVRFDPQPAFVNGESSKTTVAAMTASKDEPPRRTISLACETRLKHKIAVCF